MYSAMLVLFLKVTGMEMTCDLRAADSNVTGDLIGKCEHNVSRYSFSSSDPNAFLPRNRYKKGQVQKNPRFLFLICGNVSPQNLFFQLFH